MSEDQELRDCALRHAINAFCPKVISASHVVESAKVFETYLRSIAGDTLKDFVASEVQAV